MSLRILARDNNVHIIKLPPHMAHFLQPLDVTFFKPLKTAWNKAVGDFTRRELKSVTKAHFLAALSTVWENSCKSSHATSGFRCTGIYPYNPDAISPDAFKPNVRFKNVENKDEENEGGNKDATQRQSDDSGDSTEDENDNNDNRECDGSNVNGNMDMEVEESNTGPSIVEALTDTGMNTNTHILMEPVLIQSTPGESSVLSQTPLSSHATQEQTPVSLHDYFALLFRSQSQIRNHPRRRLVGMGESLTSDEAIKRWRKKMRIKKEK